MNSLISNVGSIIYFQKNLIQLLLITMKNLKVYLNGINNLLQKVWVRKGILPIVSNMPRDNHSVMQLYLDGFDNNFFTFFYVKDKKSPKINNNLILKSKKILKNKKISDVSYLQKISTENVFRKKNIPFRSFEIKERDEKTLGELLVFLF